MSDLVQVLMSPHLRAPFEQWLAERHLHLYPIPVEGTAGRLTTDQEERVRQGDLPTYGIGIGPP